MGRAIAGVIVGYVVMFVVVFGVFSGAYVLMGADRAFQPGTYEVSLTWIVMSIAVSLVAAALGGLTCALIASRGSKAPMVLAGALLVLGLAMAYPVIFDTRPDPGPRTADVPNLEAMSRAKQPIWAAIANPIIGAAGVLAGASLRWRRVPG